MQKNKVTWCAEKIVNRSNLQEFNKTTSPVGVVSNIYNVNFLLIPMLKHSFKLLGAVLLSFVVTFPVQALDLSRYQGQIVYLDFWASWCGPCIKSFPWMQTMHERYGEKGLKIIAVTVDEDAKEVEAFLSKHPVGFEIVHDPEGKLAKEYDLIAMPTSILFDRNGKQLSRHVSFRNDKAEGYEEAIKQALTTP